MESVDAIWVLVAVYMMCLEDLGHNRTNSAAHKFHHIQQ